MLTKAALASGLAVTFGIGIIVAAAVLVELTLALVVIVNPIRPWLDANPIALVAVVVWLAAWLWGVVSALVAPYNQEP